MNSNQRRLLFKLIPYPVLALLGGWIYFIVERGILGPSTIYPATGNPYDSTTSFIAICVMTVLMGTTLGTIEETFFKYRLKRFPFFIKITLKTTLYVLVVLLLLFVVSFFINSINMGLPIFDQQVIATIKAFFFSFTLVSIIIFIGAVIGASLFFSEIVDFLGLDVVYSFFTGKYSKSVIEDRVFMFLDMKGSTTIAEKIGHENHYKLINEYYADMTNPVVKTKGHIYQYVGDEIVVFWDTEDGLAEANCLKCFYLIKKQIERRSEYYLNNYGLVPGFKAGVHFGQITRGQVGLIKRELLFTGDVLNTTSRIQSLCNELGSDLLISDELKEAISSSSFEYLDKGSFNLKGRDQRISLFEVKEQITNENQQ